MKALLISFLCFCFFSFSYSQTDSTETKPDSTNVINSSLEKTKPYRAWVYTPSEYYPVRGYLYQLDESSITIIPDLENTLEIAQRSFPISDIQQLRFRTKGRVKKGMLIGALSGFAIGGLLGLAEGDDYCNPTSWCILTFSAEDKAILYGTPMSVIGLAVGGILGGLKIRIPINRKKETYKSQKQGLKKFLIKR